MPGTVGFVLAAVGLLMVGFALFFGRESSVALAELPAEHRRLLGKEIEAFGGGDIPLSQLNVMLLRAATRFQAEKQAVEARAAKEATERQASLEAEIARRTAAYRRQVPPELQAIIDQKVAEEARATAEAKTGLAQARATVGELQAENKRLGLELRKSTAEARGASRAVARTNELHDQLVEFAATKAELERRIAELCRERGELLRLLEGAASGPLLWRESPPPRLDPFH